MSLIRFGLVVTLVVVMVAQIESNLTSNRGIIGAAGLEPRESEVCGVRGMFYDEGGVRESSRKREGFLFLGEVF